LILTDELIKDMLKARKEAGLLDDIETDISEEDG
ncbi:MAG: ribosome maturation factor RimP, partial [Pseudomonadota bacterium]